MKIQSIKFKGRVYLRAEDVVEMLIEFGSSEVTGVRTRTYELAKNVANSFDVPCNIE